MLWIVRANQTNRMTKFLENNIIAAHWDIRDLTGCSTKKDIENVVAQANLKPRAASLKVGLLNRFVTQMKIGDHCIVPCNDVFYVGIIKSDYYFDSNLQNFKHQRKVHWLFDGKPFSRNELPLGIYGATDSIAWLLDMTKHKSVFIKYLIHKQGIEPSSFESDLLSLKESALDSLINETSLLVDALKILRYEINNGDSDKGLKAVNSIGELCNKIDRICDLK